MIRAYPEEGAILVRKCNTGKDCNCSWTELNTDNGEIGPRSRPYQPEVFEPSGPGYVFFWAGYQKIILFSPFLLSPYPLSSILVLGTSGTWQLQLDKLPLSSWLVTLASGPPLNHLTSDSLSSLYISTSVGPWEFEFTSYYIRNAGCEINKHQTSRSGTNRWNL